MKNIRLGLFILSIALFSMGCQERSITLSESGLGKKEPTKTDNNSPTVETVPAKLETSSESKLAEPSTNSGLPPMGKKLASLVNKRIQLDSMDKTNITEMDQVFYEYLDSQYFNQTVDLLDEILTRLIEDRWPSEDSFVEIYEALFNVSYVITPKGIRYGIASNLERAYISAILSRIDERLDGGILVDMVGLWDVYESTGSLSLLGNLSENYPTMNLTKDYSEETQRAFLNWLKAAVEAQVYEPSNSVFSSYLDRLKQEMKDYATPIEGRTPKTPYPYESDLIIYSIQTLIRLEADLPDTLEEERNQIYAIVYEALMPWDKYSPDEINEQIIPFVSLLSDHHDELSELVENHRNVYIQKLDTAKRFKDERPEDVARWNEYVTRSNAVILELEKN